MVQPKMWPHFVEFGLQVLITKDAVALAVEKVLVRAPLLVAMIAVDAFERAIL